MAYKKISAVTQAIVKLFDDALRRLQIEINGHVAAENNIQIPQFWNIKRTLGEIMIAEFHVLFDLVNQLVLITTFMKVSPDIFLGHMRKIAECVTPLLGQSQCLVIDISRKNRNIQIF